MRRTAIVIGVAGGTASGKSSLVNSVISEIGDELATRIGLDSYYHDQSDLAACDRDSLNYDHPDAIDFEKIAIDLATLATGQPIHVPIYDFETHVRMGSYEVKPRRIIVVEGILALASEILRAHFDVSVFIDASPAIRFARRLERDVSERGMQRQAVVKQYQKYCWPMHVEFVEPCKARADVVIANEANMADAICALKAVVLNANGGNCN